MMRPLLTKCWRMRAADRERRHVAHLCQIGRAEIENGVDEKRLVARGSTSPLLQRFSHKSKYEVYVYNVPYQQYRRQHNATGKRWSRQFFRKRTFKIKPLFLSPIVRVWWVGLQVKLATVLLLRASCWVYSPQELMNATWTIQTGRAKWIIKAHWRCQDCKLKLNPCTNPGIVIQVDQTGLLSTWNDLTRVAVLWKLRVKVVLIS